MECINNKSVAVLYENKCGKAGFDILSPAYTALRDGNQSTKPESYHGEGYEAPLFKMLKVGIEKKMSPIVSVCKRNVLWFYN